MSLVAGPVFGIAGLLTLIAVLPLAAAAVRLPCTVLLAVVGYGLGVAIGIADGLPAPAAGHQLLLL